MPRWRTVLPRARVLSICRSEAPAKLSFSYDEAAWDTHQARSSKLALELAKVCRAPEPALHPRWGRCHEIHIPPCCADPHALLCCVLRLAVC
jgi:hypothetical protein